MKLHNSPEGYLFNLQVCSSGEAKRLWRKSIKEEWNNKCAYCGSDEELTIDHIVPQSKGGINFLTNVVCCCRKCNANKSHDDWIDWFSKQDFFTEERMVAIIQWMKPFKKTPLHKYNKRNNIVY
jgi:CRISPR/Cas system Type II protein with McrA/HNH and RuvC-like nuclease domain